MQNFVYLIGDQATRECMVVDPAWDIDGIVDLVAADDMRLTGVLVTHTHQDHVGGHLFGHDIPGIPELLGKHPAKVYVHRAEREFLKGFGSDLVKVEAGDTLQVGAIPPRSCTRRGTPRLAVLPGGRLPHLGRHSLHPLLRAHRSARQRSEGDVHPPPSGSARSRRHGGAARPQPWGSQTTIGAEKENPMMRLRVHERSSWEPWAAAGRAPSLPLRGSAQRHPAVDEEHLPGHVVGARGEEPHRLRHVRGPAGRPIGIRAAARLAAPRSGKPAGRRTTPGATALT
jgi:hypothetical protein